MKIQDLSFTFHTDKLKECADFYVKYFGAKITFDAQWYITVKFDSDAGPDISLSFMSPEYANKPVRNLGAVTINIGVEDVDAEYMRIKASGLPILRDIADQKWGDRSFEANDPLDNTLYIYSPRELDDEYKSAVIE